MSAHHAVAALMVAAGIACLLYAAVVAVAAAYRNPGVHARISRRRYHRLTCDQRRDWRRNRARIA